MGRLQFLGGEGVPKCRHLRTRGGEGSQECRRLHFFRNNQDTFHIKKTENFLSFVLSVDR